MDKRNFTLVELLVVIGIIAILAGLLTPAVIGAQQQGRITQARSDMATILMALKGLDGTYGKMVARSGGNYQMGGSNWATDSDSSSNVKNARLDGPSSTAAYYAFIAELSDPSNGHLSTVSVNRRRMKFLDPKPEYNPGVNYDDAVNTPHLWLDPWGNPYVILVNVDYTEQIVDPTNSSNLVSGKAIAYSYGPDGASANADDQKDNVCSWKDSWF
jgi:prepilin-type N-terminal cleavage/methylation domain-containing protein